ncbi:hypothetical protein [Weissella cibaria]|nr:hypothetical protein [Weissella cibaria]MDY2519488.1 hypothetical protein [Weissella cibaria]
MSKPNQNATNAEAYFQQPITKRDDYLFQQELKAQVSAGIYIS